MKSVVRWNPIQDFSSVQDELNQLMRDVFVRQPLAVWQPPIDVEETPESYKVHLELPGMRLEDIKITLEDDRLTIRGEKSRTEEQKDATYHRLERVYGTFERSFSLTHAVKSDKIEATYRDGVLEVTVPKAEEAKPREIPIKVAR